MAKKEKSPLSEAEKIEQELKKAKAELEAISAPEEKSVAKKKTKAPKKEKKPKAAPKEAEVKEPAAKKEKKKKAPKKEKKPKAVTKEEKKKKKAATKEEKKKKKAATKEEKKKEAVKEEKKTFEEELEEQLTDEEITSFQIEKMDMEKLTNKVCEIVAAYESNGMLQSELWKKLKLTSRDGSRLALKLERMGIITREKILEKGRWTYKLIIKKTPVSTLSIEEAPCLTCPVEQKCSLEGEISPRTCKLIEDWVLAGISNSKKKTK